MKKILSPRSFYYTSKFDTIFVRKKLKNSNVYATDARFGRT